MKQKGTLVVARTNSEGDRFVAYLLDVNAGCVMESSGSLNEDDLRALLKDSFGESEAMISERISRARAHPSV